MRFVNNAVVDAGLRTPRPMDEMEGGVPDDEGNVEEYYVQQGKDTKVLFAMAIGLYDKDDGGATFLYWSRLAIINYHPLPY